jgi:saccharopine dehydrogenase-like NADP-dependent oxidoreductase
MTKVAVIGGGRYSEEVAKMLAELEGIEVVDAKNVSKSDVLSICPTGHEDFSSLKVRAEPLLENNETWRGRGKRRKPMCK